jgi:hypothetical protein
MSDMMNSAGKIIQQFESDHEITDSSEHINHILNIVQQMENKIHKIFTSSCSENKENCIDLQQADIKLNDLFTENQQVGQIKMK